MNVENHPMDSRTRQSLPDKALRIAWRLGALLLLLCVGGAWGQSLGEVSPWRNAVAAYEEKDYAEAERLFNEMIQATPRTALPAPDLLFNLGDTYYQQGRKGMAAWMFERCLAAAPRHADARANLALVRRESGVPRAEAFFLFRPLSAILHRLTAGEWALAFTLFYALASLFGAGWILLRTNGRPRRLCRAFCVLFACFMATTGLFLAPRYIDTEHRHYGVVVADDAIVRSAPGDDEAEYFEALAGERLAVTESDRIGWLRVKRMADGRVGYLPEEVLRKI
jgi:tetratricopeptide (TPR) repeat protein